MDYLADSLSQYEIMREVQSLRAFLVSKYLEAKKSEKRRMKVDTSEVS